MTDTGNFFQHDFTIGNDSSVGCFVFVEFQQICFHRQQLHFDKLVKRFRRQTTEKLKHINIINILKTNQTIKSYISQRNAHLFTLRNRTVRHGLPIGFSFFQNPHQLLNVGKPNYTIENCSRNRRIQIVHQHVRSLQLEHRSLEVHTDGWQHFALNVNRAESLGGGGQQTTCLVPDPQIGMVQICCTLSDEIRQAGFPDESHFAESRSGGNRLDDDKLIQIGEALGKVGQLIKCVFQLHSEENYLL